MTRVMRDFEAVVISGTHRFANTEGYGRAVRYTSSAFLAAPPLVAIDAIPLQRQSHKAEFWKPNIDREIQKAFTGFCCGTSISAVECDPKIFSQISTGHWGCGIFGGTRLFKALLQWIAASEAGRGVRYCPFEDWPEGDKLERLTSRLCEQRKTVSITLFRQGVRLLSGLIIPTVRSKQVGHLYPKLIEILESGYPDMERVLQRLEEEILEK